MWSKIVWFYLWAKFSFARWWYDRAIAMVQSTASEIAYRIFGEP